VSGCEDVFQGLWCLVFGSQHRLPARDKQCFWRLVSTDHSLTANAIPRTGLPAGYPGVDLEGGVSSRLSKHRWQTCYAYLSLRHIWSLVITPSVLATPENRSNSDPISMNRDATISRYRRASRQTDDLSLLRIR
jgi:hypothetical protein